MALNYKRKSSASASSRNSKPAVSSRRTSSSRSCFQQSRSGSDPRSCNSASRVSGRRNVAAFRNGARSGYQAYQNLSSVRVGDINQAIRDHRVQKSYRRYIIRIFIVLALLAMLLVAGIVVYNSSLFTIENITVKGVEHLTATEMTNLASVPAGTTLLRVDEAGIKGRLSEEAWVESISVKRVFPDTLELVITERKIAAIVEVPANNAQTTENWTIASDGIWLMLVPAEDSEEASSVNPKIFEDAASVLRITGVPYGIAPIVGEHCSDNNVNNALSIVSGLSTSLADQVKTVSATGTETTTLILTNGVEIAFGTAENIREKERVCLQLMEENPGTIAYINVRVVDKPTWRASE